MVYYQYCDIIWSIRFCSKICHVGGRMLSAPTFGACNDGGRVPPNYRAEISVRCRGRYYLPGCFPAGETTSAQCADNMGWQLSMAKPRAGCPGLTYIGQRICWMDQIIFLFFRTATAARPMAETVMVVKTTLMLSPVLGLDLSALEADLLVALVRTT